MSEENKDKLTNGATEQTSDKSTGIFENVVDEFEALGDIIEKRSDAKVIFNRYKNKTEIAQKIINVLLTRKYNSGKGNQAKRFAKGFYNNDMDRTQVGLLTQCLGLQALASLSTYGLDMTSYSGIIDHTLNDIFKQIGFNNETYFKIVAMGDHINFDNEILMYNMTPYVKSSEYEDDDEEAVTVNTCVESACNVLKAISETREMIIAHEDSGKKLALTLADSPVDGETMVRMLEYLIKYTVAWLVSACIKAKRNMNYLIAGKRAKNSLIPYLGWNFFKITNTTEDYEPSLYMTYSACSAYISLQQSVQDVKNDLDNNIINDTPGYRYIQNKRLYGLIFNDYNEFKNQCMSAGRYEEMRANGLLGGKEIDLASKFIGQNYAAMGFTDIENSTTNDAVINTILHVLILIYSGIDIDYDILGKADEFFDEMQYALQNALRCYKYLLKEDKTYIIDQYFLSFKEKMPSSVIGLAKILRRQRIQVTSLLPLLIRAYNEVSKYLIKYPQKQNIEYLRLILENRSDADKGKEWAWDKDGYNITSENYFIKALRSFYEYYEEYEECYIDPEEVLLSEREKFANDAERRIDAIKKELTQEKEALSQIIAEKDKIIDALKASREPLIQEIIALIKETISRNLDDMIVASINSAINSKFANEFGNAIGKLVVERYCGENLRNLGYTVDDTIIKKANEHIKKVLNSNINRTLSGEDK